MGSTQPPSHPFHGDKMETFVAQMQKQGRVHVPENVQKLLKLKPGQMLRVSVERVK